MRQAGQIDVGDFAPDVEVHHLTVLARARRADEVLIDWSKKKSSR